jgi:tetratricopeptide (TPR) repeat protein
MTKFTSKISELFAQKKFDQICTEFEGREAELMSVNLYLLKATSIQLAQNTCYTLQDARDSLKAAVTLEPNHTQVWLDLAHFYFAVDDSPVLALECFGKARILVQKLHEDLVIGEVKTLLELGRKQEALSILRSIPQANSTEDILALQEECLSKS